MSLNYWNLITKYLTGENSPEENDELLKWIDERSVNKELLKKAESLWELSGKYNVDFKPDTNRDWEELKVKIIAESAATKFSISGKTTNWWFKTAAVLLLLIGIGYFVKTAFETDEKAMLSESVAYIDVETTDSINVFYLPDDTKIWLNKNSRFTHPAKFVDKERREVTLNGEAFFEVIEDTTKPFIVFAGNTQTTVLGTSFNIRAYDDEDEVEVSVVTGEVELSPKDRSEDAKVIKAGEKGTFNKKSGSVKKQKNKNENLKWWVKGMEKDVKRFIKKVRKKLNLKKKDKN